VTHEFVGELVRLVALNSGGFLSLGERPRQRCATRSSFLLRRSAWHCSRRAFRSAARSHALRS
jgi:hypothetical protein